MKQVFTLLFSLLASTAYAQFTPNETTYCNRFGTGVMCSQPNGQSTMITPLGPGMSTWSNSQGQSGTIVTPLPETQFEPPKPIAPMQPFTSPYAPQYKR